MTNYVRARKEGERRILPSRRLGWILFVAFVVASSLPARPFCSEPQPRLICAEYFASQLVVEATLVNTEKELWKNDPDGILARVYTLRVNRNLRGELTETIRVYEENDSGRAAFDWVRGRKYLLFLFHTRGKTTWSLDGCGNSGPVAKAARALAVIEQVKSRGGSGFIHGRASDEVLSSGLSGVRVEVSGAAGRFSAKTNSRGNFRIEVPPGNYSVMSARTDDGDVFETSDISYIDGKNIQIQPGGCAQIQLFRVKR